MVYEIAGMDDSGVFKIFMGTRLAETALAKHCRAAKPEMLCLQAEFDLLIKQSRLSTPAIDRLRRYLLSSNMNNNEGSS